MRGGLSSHAVSPCPLSREALRAGVAPRPHPWDSRAPARLLWGDPAARTALGGHFPSSESVPTPHLPRSRSHLGQAVQEASSWARGPVRPPLPSPPWPSPGLFACQKGCGNRASGTGANRWEAPGGAWRRLVSLYRRGREGSPAPSRSGHLCQVLATDNHPAGGKGPFLRGSASPRPRRRSWAPGPGS